MVEYKVKIPARIMEISNAANATWEDVSKIKVEGQVYKKGDIVSSGGIICRIEHFNTFDVCLTAVGDPNSTVFTREYANIELMAAPHKKVRLDPNTAFRYKKKRGVF